MPHKLPSMPDFDKLYSIKDDSIRLTVEKLIKYIEELRAQVEKDLV